MSDDYSEYFEGRTISAPAQPVVKYWHGRMLQFAASVIGDLGQKTLLEIGAGWGFIASSCRERGIRYLGVELNGAQAASLRAAGHDVSEGAIPPVPPGPPVNVIWMSHVLEHAPTYTDAKAMLVSCRERLEPGGHVVILCPDIRSWGDEFWGCDWSHGFPTTLRRLKQIVSDAGFEVVDARHHTASVTSKAPELLLHGLFSAIPYNLLDAAISPFTERTLFYSFMGVFGWRQLSVIGQKAR